MAERETYKGIEFIRISKLSTEQKAKIHDSFPKDKIIKILREDEVILNDCIQYHEYQEWFRLYHQSAINGAPVKAENVKNISLNYSVK